MSHRAHNHPSREANAEPQQPGRTSTKGSIIAIAVGVSSGLGAMAASITGNWHWMPIILSMCIGLAGTAAGLTTWMASRHKP